MFIWAVSVDSMRHSRKLAGSAGKPRKMASKAHLPPLTRSESMSNMTTSEQLLWSISAGFHTGFPNTQKEELRDHLRTFFPDTEFGFQLGYALEAFLSDGSPSNREALKEAYMACMKELDSYMQQ
jgi:hypothetical protein